MNNTFTTSEDLEKLALIERVFHSLTKEELLSLLSQDLVVAKLKGDSSRVGVLTGLTLDNTSHDVNIQRLSAELMTLRSDYFTLKSDFNILIRFINEKFSMNSNTYGSNVVNDFNSMKSRNGIY